MPPAVNSRAPPKASTSRPPAIAAGIWASAAAPNTRPMDASATPTRVSARGIEAGKA